VVNEFVNGSKAGRDVDEETGARRCQARGIIDALPMDPLRSDTRPTEALTGAEREARIEQLLLSGLDEYFAQRYESAISLWTRVLFFDRHHDRARAYIERARRAQAERQRESEAVLHQGIEAFRAGDVVRARQLLSEALDRGASPDDAQGVLERIERLGAAQVAPKGRRRNIISSSVSLTTRHRAASEPARSPHGHARGWAAALLLALAALGVLAVGTWGWTVPEPWGWAVFSTAPSRATEVVRWAPEPLPRARASEAALSRARALIATGRLHDALAVLERVPVGDSLYKEAERVRADVQERLLAIALPAPPAAASAGR
jgi:thioredoxin-like negative regulator of GroEL